jgi:transcriptional regulator with XRE-family HTH domain
MKIHQCFDRVLKQYNITGKQLSEVSGVTQAAISDFRNGKKNPGTDTLDRLLAALKEISPQASLQLCFLMAGEEIDLVKLVAIAPLKTQGAILRTIGSCGVFQLPHSTPTTANL